mgnify:CR=1 FL=1
MKYLRILLLINLVLLFFSCGKLKEGFINQKKHSSDEFLVEKKSPLTMPPDYKELPVPKTDENLINSEESEIKSLITNQDNKETNSTNDQDVNQNIEESLLKKIKKN